MKFYEKMVHIPKACEIYHLSSEIHVNFVKMGPLQKLENSRSFESHMVKVNIYKKLA